jgi:hypothetical protein
MASALYRVAPDLSQVEEHLLSACLIDGGESLKRCQSEGIEPASFSAPANQIIFGLLIDLQRRGIAPEASVLAQELIQTGQLDTVGGYAYVAQVSNTAPTTAQVAHFAKILRIENVRRKLTDRVAELKEALADRGKDLPEIIARFSADLPSLEVPGSIIQRLSERRAGFGRTIVKQQPTFYLNDTTVCTRGNLAMITALQKVGKSAVVGAMLGAVIAGKRSAGDTLRLKSQNEDGQAVIHLDTEQAPEDHEVLIKTAMRRAAISQLPDWLFSYGMKGVSIRELGLTLEGLLAESVRTHGGVHSVILDGVADFVADPNDPKEVNPFVTNIEGLASQFRCSIICVLHLNPPGSGRQQAPQTKSRGHLGSQLERKCETDLRLAKDKDGVTTLFTACARRSPIFEKDGPRFAFDTTAGMHTLCAQTRGQVREQDTRTAYALNAEAVFEGRPGGMIHKDLVAAIMTTLDRGESTAVKDIQNWHRAGVIGKGQFNLYHRVG